MKNIFPNEIDFDLFSKVQDQCSKKFAVIAAMAHNGTPWLTLCSRVFFREERERRGRKVGGKEKNVVFSSFFKERKERKGRENNIDFPFKTFLPNVGGKGRKGNERIKK